jgi:hypothetical protein
MSAAVTAVPLAPTRLQQLGLAIRGQYRVSAIRFTSDAWRAGTEGWNVAIFPSAIVAPSRVRILGKSGAALDGTARCDGAAGEPVDADERDGGDDSVHQRVIVAEDGVLHRVGTT